MKKTLLALASIALVSSVAVSADAADFDFKVRTIEGVGGYQKIDKIKVAKADDVAIGQQNAKLNIDFESDQPVGKAKFDVASAGLTLGVQDIDSINLDDVKKVAVTQTNLGTGINVKLGN